MTNASPPPGGYDWNRLAQEALDLWQDHLDACASDPQVKAEMARFMAPMSQMFAQWSSMVQHTLDGARSSPSSRSPDAGAAPSAGGGGDAPVAGSPAASAAPGGVAPQPEAAGPASALGDDGMAELADRVASLERQLEELESLWGDAPSSGAASGADGAVAEAAAGGSGGRRRGKPATGGR